MDPSDLEAMERWRMGAFESDNPLRKEMLENEKLPGEIPDDERTEKGPYVLPAGFSKYKCKYCTRKVLVKSAPCFVCKSALGYTKPEATQKADRLLHDESLCKANDAWATWAATKRPHELQNYYYIGWLPRWATTREWHLKDVPTRDAAMASLHEILREAVEQWDKWETKLGGPPISVPSEKLQHFIEAAEEANK